MIRRRRPAPAASAAGTAAGSNVHLRCRVLDGVYQRGIDGGIRSRSLDAADRPAAAGGAGRKPGQNAGSPLLSALIPNAHAMPAPSCPMGALAARQPVETPLTDAAMFLVLTVAEGDPALDAVRTLFGDMASLVKAVGFRGAEAGLSCIVGIGDTLWQRLHLQRKPQGLHPFQEIDGVHRAPATPGDLLLHLRAAGMDYCYELATHVMQRLGAAVAVADETHGFRFFDNRDLLGFVDGTENPVGAALTAAVTVGGEDAPFAGGSYVIVQKYLHDLAAWNAQPVEQQERAIGRAKLSDIEFPDAQKPSFAHNVLTNISDENGRQLEILRGNMPFGRFDRGEAGTYFIGYACEPGRIERMLRNMFIGDPPGNCDRLLDVSRAVTGSLFFVPTADMLEALADGDPTAEPAEAAAAAAAPAPSTPFAASTPGSLGIGSLKTRPAAQPDPNSNAQGATS